MKKHQSSRYINYINSEAWRKKSLWVKNLTRPWWTSKYAKGRWSPPCTVVEIFAHVNSQTFSLEAAYSIFCKYLS